MASKKDPRLERAGEAPIIASMCLQKSHVVVAKEADKVKW